jgi:hypothetical protein
MKLFEFFNVPIDKDSKPKKIGTSDIDKQKLSDEVFWFILDNDALHKEFVLPFVSQLKDTITSADFNKERFSKMWAPMVAKGCNLYHKKEKLKDNPKSLFDQELKDGLCQQISDKFIEEFQENIYQVGEYKV